MASRVDEHGAARAGSQLQTQLYVNKRADELDRAIRAVFPELANATFDWRSPLADDSYREYADAAFLKRLRLDDHIDALAQFWPRRGGPHWDALACVVLPDGDGTGVLLAEGKSYPDEMLNGSGLAATAPESTRRIREALAWTQGRIGIPLDVDAWTGELYQNANRLAHLYWLRSRGVRAWLVHLLFTGDPHGSTTSEQWETALKMADERLGIAGVAIDGAGHILLPAGTRDELNPA